MSANHAQCVRQLTLHSVPLCSVPVNCETTTHLPGAARAVSLVGSKSIRPSLVCFSKSVSSEATDFNSLLCSFDFDLLAFVGVFGDDLTLSLVALKFMDSNERESTTSRGDPQSSFALGLLWMFTFICSS